jgi:hypothetical protein
MAQTQEAARVTTTSAHELLRQLDGLFYGVVGLIALFVVWLVKLMWEMA